MHRTVVPVELDQLDGAVVGALKAGCDVVDGRGRDELQRGHNLDAYS